MKKHGNGDKIAKKLKLIENMGQVVTAHGYELDTTERYVINIGHELS
ncbi:hypothetical protein K160097B7_03610 [[Clostridium] hylemonae]|nr:hypothetical protein [[Clostridium] hylemonae]